MLEATLMEGVDREAKLYAEEAFGPVAILSRFEDFDAALDEVNDSKFGLQAGVFTRDLFRTLTAWDRLEVGGVVSGRWSSPATGSTTCRLWRRQGFRHRPGRHRSR